MQTNPLLREPLLNDHTFAPFAEIKNEHFGPALEEGMRRARVALARIATGPANFKDVIEGIESHRETLDQARAVFFNLLSAHTNDFLQTLAKDISPKLAELSNDLLLNPAIFSRVKEIHEKRDSLNLNQEQLKLLEITYKSFRRNGALLSEEEKENLREIDRKLAVLKQDFSDHVLKATNEFILFVDDADSLANLPKGALEDAAATAKEKGRPNSFAFTLHHPSIMPFLQFCTSGELRRQLWLANSSKCMSGSYDNQSIVMQISKLRHQRAILLGYKSHGDFVLEERMAGTPEKVKGFLQELLEASLPAAKKDLEELRALKEKTTGETEIFPWDIAFYSEKLRAEKYDLKQEEIRPYFLLENAIKGVFEHGRKLFGVVFQERSDIPVYHPDVRAYEVREEKGGKLVGFFFADFFPRASKRSGAWMTNFLEQGTWAGRLCRPHVSIVCNFTKPSTTQPSLLTLDEVKTLFHEFGHALHSLLSECHYTSLSGTNVYWDFVELPSQIMENWVTEQESLGIFARHYLTGEAMPPPLVQKIKASTKFQSGWMAMRQISFSLLDMAWHSNDPSAISDLEAFERETLSKIRFFPPTKGTSISAAFSHIFAGGYSSGYYSYKWAEVLDADAFELFKEKGVFNRQVADEFRKNVLSKGGTEHPMELYRRFRGREPQLRALLARDGLESR
jgi:peptidyl-dipeptidase Dcp